MRVKTDGSRSPFSGVTLAEHALVAPGETSILDDHYGGPRPEAHAGRSTEDSRREWPSAPSDRSPRPSSRERPPAGMTSLKGDLAELAASSVAHGREALVGALERARCLRAIPRA